MSRLAAVVGWGKSGQGAAGALLARDWQVRAFDARGGQSLFFDDVAGVEVHAEQDPTALVNAIIEAGPDLVVVSPGVPAHHPVFAACGQASTCGARWNSPGVYRRRARTRDVRG